MRLVVTGGGTGGHIYPALAVVEAVRASVAGAEVCYIGGAAGIEANIVPAAGLTFHGVTTRKLRRLVSPSTIGVLLALFKGYREASAQLRQFRPEVVVSTGGYVAAATTIAAARQHVPTVILAPDAVPGRTNRWLARWATRICVMFEETVTHFPKEKTVVTGLPIRAGIVSDRSSAGARQSFGMNPDAFTVLATGGSQGAQRLNEIVRGSLPLLGTDIQILHQVGTRGAEGTTGGREEGNRYISIPFLDSEQMPLAYRTADLTVCRCGAGSLAEATANGLPMLMVPLPTAYADHQTANARAMERAGGGILLPQPELTVERLAAEIVALTTDAARRGKLAELSRAAGRPDAASRVAEIAREVV